MQSAGFEAILPPESPRLPAQISPAESSMHPAVASGATARRLAGGTAALASGALLTVAAILTPAEGGLGTHRQILSQPCAWVASMDCPCPTCGMTTAFAHAADGDLMASLIAQPMGALLAIATAMTFLLGSYVAVTGSRVAHRLTRLWRPRLLWILAALVLGAWLYKIIWYKGWL